MIDSKKPLTPLPEESTLYVRIWTGQRCAACGAEFQYMRRSIVQRRDMERAATIAMVEAQCKEQALVVTETCPCPHCGWIQPDMAGGARSVRHGMATFYTFLALLVSAIATGLSILPGVLGCGVSAGIAMILLMFHLYLMFSNANRNRERNLQAAQRRLEQGSLRLIKPGDATDAPAVPVPLGNTLIAVGMLLASAFSFLTPALFGWPLLAGQAPGMILFIFSGSMFGNIAFDRKQFACPIEVTEVNSTLVVDESVPEDFRTT